MQTRAVRRELVDEAIASDGNVVVVICILVGECHKQVAADVVDAEWRKTRWDSWIRKDVDDVEIAVEDFHLSEAEVRRIQELAGGRGYERESLVDRTVIAFRVSCLRPVDGDHGL